MNPLDQFLPAYSESFPHYREDLALHTTYAEFLCDTIERRAARSVLSLGLGHSIVAESLASLNLPTYHIVEGSSAIVDRFPDSAATIELSLFETFQTDRRFDLIEMGFVLEHVDDPELVVRRYTGFLAPGGIVIAAVPNALSLHRRLGLAAGLLPDPYALAAADRALGHQRYFDFASFSELMTRCGLRTRAAVGLLLKPFTTAQLQQLNLSDAVWRALCSEGLHWPELANAFALELEPVG